MRPALGAQLPVLFLWSVMPLVLLPGFLILKLSLCQVGNQGEVYWYFYVSRHFLSPFLLECPSHVGSSLAFRLAEAFPGFAVQEL